MPNNKYFKMGEKLLAVADVQINGSRPWDLRVKNNDFFKRVFTQGSLGLGESYVEGWWECPALDQFFFRVLSQNLDKKILSAKDTLGLIKAKLLNLGSPSRAFEVGRHHYDMGNELYQGMLDSRMIYSCGYWKDAQDLNQAQEAKLELICKKLKLKPGMRLLDIGCGWGGMAQYAAQKYGVEVEGITVSKQQAALAQKKCQNLPVTIRIQDYRSLKGKFDRMVSIGMIEHVGVKNYKAYFKVAHRHLKPDGIFLLHTIGSNQSRSNVDTWIEKYIFPNSMLPSGKQLLEASEGLFIMEDWHSMGPHYDKTLMCWYQNFLAAWSQLKKRYDQAFFRMWTYYLLACAGCFRARQIQLWQLVLSPRGIPGEYTCPR